LAIYRTPKYGPEETVAAAMVDYQIRHKTDISELETKIEKLRTSTNHNAQRISFLHADNRIARPDDQIL
jgi:hypothetical protein